MEYCFVDFVKVCVLMDFLEKLFVDVYEDRGVNESFSCRCYGGGLMFG